MKLMAVFLIVLFFCGGNSGGAYASSSTNIEKHLYGTWCLNTEEYEGDFTVEGSMWTFRRDGTYIYKHAYESTEKFSIVGDKLHLENFGKMKIIKITTEEMTGKVFSNYHFTKDKCLPLVDRAVKTTMINNAIISNDQKTIKKLVNEGADISAKDLRSGLQSTPLMVAIEHADTQMVKYILSLKPDLKVTNAAGETALDVAKKIKNTAAVKLIKKTAIE